MSPTLPARLVTRHPWITLAVLAIVTAVQGWYAFGLSVDFSLEGLFLSDAPELRTYREFRDVYGPDDHHIFLLFRTPDLFTPEALGALERLTARVERLDGVTAVLSLARFRGLAGPLAAAFGGETVAQVAARPEGLARFRAWATSNRMLVRGLVSENGQTACVVVAGDLPSGERSTRVRQLLDRIEAAVAAERQVSDYELHIAGIPTIEAEYVRFIRDDQRTFIPLVILLFLILCSAYFQSLRAAVIPMLTVGTAVIWLLGLTAQLGRVFGILNSLLPNMILVIGVGDSIFILSEYVHQLSFGKPVREAMEDTMRVMTVPCLLTSFTSAIGFGTLCTTEIGIVREFGALAAAGLMLAYVASITVPAALISAFRVVLPPIEGGVLSRRIVRFVGWVGRVNRHHRRWIVIVGCATLVASLWASTRTRAESSWFQDLKADSPITRAHAFAYHHLAGLFTLEATLTAPDGDPGDMLTGARLQGLAELQRLLEQQSTVSHSVSAADLVREILRAGSGRVEAPDGVVTLRAGQAARALQLARAFGAGGAVDSYVRRDGRQVRLSIRLGRTTSIGLFDMMALAQQRAGELLPGVRLEFTGKNLLGARALRGVVDNMLQSLGLALVLIFACMGLMLRSLRMGLLSMIPNVMPMVVTFGMMGLTGIAINFSTMTVFSISLGVAVDNTIHFLAKFKEINRRIVDPVAASAETLALIGNGMTISGGILIAGFLTVTTSNFGFTANFGWLGAITMVGALAADLFLTPLLALLCAPRGAAAAQS